MKILGIQKMTLLDFPEKIACTVFTGGCNMRCPFCHNASLVFCKDKEPIMSEEDFFEFLTKRKKILDGVCITGGEPIIQKDIFEFIEKIKSFGFLVKLDTNGTFPKLLKEAVENKLIDYTAVDIKNSKMSYAKTMGASNQLLKKVEETVDFLLSDNVDYEFRTTVVKEFHTKKNFVEISKWLKGAKRYYLQEFVDSGNTIEKGLNPVSIEELEFFLSIVKENIPNSFIRR